MNAELTELKKEIDDYRSRNKRVVIDRRKAKRVDSVDRRSNYESARENIINADYCPWIINMQLDALDVNEGIKK